LIFPVCQQHSVKFGSNQSIEAIRLKPESPLKISRDEIRVLYAEGEAAVILLVEGLVERINRLEARVEALENQLSKNSRNSSKPPSGDGFGKRTKSLRPKSERPRGGQPGHPGSHLECCTDPDVIEQYFGHFFERKRVKIDKERFIR
jgi:hypothetical protein